LPFPSSVRTPCGCVEFPCSDPGEWYSAQKPSEMLPSVNAGGQLLGQIRSDSVRPRNWSISDSATRRTVQPGRWPIGKRLLTNSRRRSDSDGFPTQLPSQRTSQNDMAAESVALCSVTGNTSDAELSHSVNQRMSSSSPIALPRHCGRPLPNCSLRAPGLCDLAQLLEGPSSECWPLPVSNFADWGSNTPPDSGNHRGPRTAAPDRCAATLRQETANVDHGGPSLWAWLSRF